METLLNDLEAAAEKKYGTERYRAMLVGTYRAVVKGVLENPTKLTAEAYKVALERTLKELQDGSI